VAELENVFTWSASRDGTFRHCERQYWWQYYGSWGGWNRDAPAEARTAYVLKNVSSRWAWVGSAVHSTIEEILRRLQTARGDGTLAFAPPAVNVERELEALTERMRREWAQSRDGEYWRAPKRVVGLMEHEYREEVPPEEWKAMSEKARTAVRGFLRSEIFDRIRKSDAARWLPIEQLEQFDFEGTGVWVVMDFALERPDGAVEIYDWKTGEVKPDVDRLQLAIYGQFLHARRALPADRVSTHVVYLGESPREFVFALGERDLEEARGFMRASIATMRSRLRDPARNEAPREAFPLTDDLSKCARCSYRRLCGRG